MTSAAPAPLLECANVALGHMEPTGERTLLARGLSFELKARSALVVVGASGSGKTTLLRLLNRFDDALEGELRFRGQRLEHYDPRELRRKVALVMQKPVMFAGSVGENLEALPPEVPKPSAEQKTAALAALGLSAAMAERPARELSGGEQHRVAIARALLLEPAALLLDEPTAALDPRAATRVGELILRLCVERELGVVVVTHSAELVRQLDARILLLEDGQAILDPPPAQLERFLAGT